MNYKAIAKQLSSLVMMMAFLLLFPLGLGILDEKSTAMFAYSLPSLLLSLIAFALRRYAGKKHDPHLGRREAILIVALIWVIFSLGGALPFLLEGSIQLPAAAIFEAVSGFTTTGATVIADVDGLSRATNLWRCLMHWIGGMGIVVLFVAIFPQLGIGAKHLFKNEAAGPIAEGVRPKIRQSALTLWWVYLVLTIVCAALLHFFGMNWFDAICHAFSTLGTGGFSTKSASIGFYHNPAIDWTVCVFMFLAGLNFGLYPQLLKGNIKGVLKDPETKVFFALNLVIAFIIVALTMTSRDSLMDSIRHSLFQTLSVTTTTGFMTEDFDKYPDLARFLLFAAMFIGACGGSTAGGLKISRLITIWKMVGRDIFLSHKPNEIYRVYVGSRFVTTDVLISVLVYLCAYLLIFVFCSSAMVFAGYDILSGSSAVVACLSSIGPGLSQFGPSENFAHAPAWAHLMLSFCMIAGRLEIIILLAPFTMKFWRR